MPDKEAKPLSSNWELLKSSMNKKKKKKNKKRSSKSVLGNNKDDSNPVPAKQMKKEDIWFDGVDPALIQESMQSDAPPKVSSDTKLVQENSTKELTKFLAIDCEMVGAGFNGRTS